MQRTTLALLHHLLSKPNCSAKGQTMGPLESAPSPDDELQFERAEGADEFDGTNCQSCQQPIVGTYYEANGSVVCPPCRDQIITQMAQGFGVQRFLMASIYGSVSAAIGSIGYFAILKLTGFEFGLIAIVVGLLVGGSVRAGSQRRGGWLYQLLAMFLTYVAIVTTYVPFILEEIQTIDAADPTVELAAQDEQGDNVVAENNEQSGDFEGEPIDFAAIPKPVLYVMVFVLAFIAPIFSFDIMSYIIIGIALYEAWKINKRVPIQISGPYQLADDLVVGTSAGDPVTGGPGIDGAGQ